jgi:hypothetical protein
MLRVFLGFLILFPWLIISGYWLFGNGNFDAFQCKFSLFFIWLSPIISFIIACVAYSLGRTIEIIENAKTLHSIAQTGLKVMKDRIVK